MKNSIKIIKLSNTYQDHEIAYQVIVNYLTLLIDTNNSFDLMWSTCYELPNFILKQILKNGDYKIEKELMLNHIISWCKDTIFNDGEKYKMDLSYLIELIMDIG